jgi:hypothetical protein
VDISPEMVRVARAKYPRLEFRVMDAEALDMDEKFDFVLISDTLGHLEDIQRAFGQLKKVCKPETRVVITYHNYLWTPLLNLAERLRLKMPSIKLNWLNTTEIRDLLYLEGFEVIRQGRRFLMPLRVPLASWLINRFVSKLPLFNGLCLTNFLICRRAEACPDTSRPPSVSVIVPARNERGNIEDAVRRTPLMGSGTEVIFVEGGSTDGTLEEIRRVCEAYRGPLKLKYATQDGRGKADAVRKGMAMAGGDVLMILDADLTVPPEDLPKFYGVFAGGKAEFVSGSRLTYPLEEQAMRFLNLLGNHFFALMFSWILGQKVTDTLCGTKAISREDYARLAANRSYFGDFDPFGDFDLMFGAAKLNLKMCEVPIRYEARRYGTTNISRFTHGALLFRMTLFAMDKLKFL